MKSRFEWMLFDLSGVISTWSLRSNVWKVINNKKYKELSFGNIYEPATYSAFELGKIAHKEFVENYLKRQKSSFTFEEFVEIFRLSVTPVKGIKNILKKLSKKYNLAILSNEGIEWADLKLDRSGSRNYFNEIIISAQIGAAKPDISFFAKSLKVLKTKPQSCLFIDDLEENINAASNFGIKSILFKNIFQLQKDLKKYIKI